MFQVCSGQVEMFLFGIVNIDNIIVKFHLCVLHDVDNPNTLEFN